MLAERALRRVVRTFQSRYVSLAPFGETTLPPPIPGRSYLLYAHVPFCELICPFCSFNRFPYSEDLAVPYFEHLRDEMRMAADLGYRFESMYVGGGTPTIMLDELCRTIDLARELFPIREVSSETNPNHLTERYLEALSPRVQRFSVGVQSFDDRLLKQMDRYDKYGSGEQVLERLAVAEGRFRSLNVDMIFNWPDQTAESLSRDVRLIRDAGFDQTTFYPLMVAPAINRRLTKAVGRVDYGTEATLYDQLSDELTSDQAFEHTTAWTFSRTSAEMIDEYIVDYEEYVGVGSGAFSWLDGTLYVNTFSLRDYARRIAEGLMPVCESSRLGRHEQMHYRFLMRLFGLRLDKREFERDFGVPIERALPLEMTFMRLAGAFAQDDAEAITLTPRGRYLMVAMMREFFVGVNKIRHHARGALSAEEKELLRLHPDGTCVVEHPEPALSATGVGS